MMLKFGVNQGGLMESHEDVKTALALLSVAANFFLIYARFYYRIFEFSVWKIAGYKPSRKEIKALDLKTAGVFSLFILISIFLTVFLAAHFEGTLSELDLYFILTLSALIISQMLSYGYLIKFPDGGRIGCMRGLGIIFIKTMWNVGSVALSWGLYFALYFVFSIGFLATFGFAIGGNTEIGDYASKENLILFNIFINSFIFIFVLAVPITKKIIKFVTKYEASSKETIFLWFYARSLRLPDGRVMGFWRVALISIIQIVVLMLAMVLYAIVYLGLAALIV